MSRNDMRPRLIASRGVLARNVLANWIVLVADVAVAFFLTPFIVTSLGLGAYGTWSLLNSIIGYMGLVDLGIRGSVGRFLNAYLARDEQPRANEIVSTSLAFLAAGSAFALLVAFGLAFNFSAVFPKTPTELLDSLPFVLPLMALGLWLALWGSVYSTVLTAFDRFDLVNAAALGGLAVRAVGTVYVLRAGHGLSGLVVVTVGATLLTGAAYSVLARRFQPGARFSWRLVSSARLSEMWRFGLVSFANRSANTLAVQAAPVLAMAFIGPAAVGIWGVCMQLIQSCRRLLEQLGAVLFPSIMRLGGKEDRSGLRALFFSYARFSFLIAGLLYFGILAFGAPFLRLWVGPEFESSTDIVQILSVADLLALLASTAALTTFSLGRLKANLIIAVSEAVGIVVLSFLFAGPLALGLPGLAFGTLIPIAIARGIAYPLVASRVVEYSYPRYLGSMLVRLGVAGALSIAVFRWIELNVGTATWSQFFATVALASLAYVPIGVAAFLRSEDRSHAAMFIRRGSRSANE